MAKKEKKYYIGKDGIKYYIIGDENPVIMSEHAIRRLTEIEVVTVVGEIDNMKQKKWPNS